MAEPAVTGGSDMRRRWGRTFLLDWKLPQVSRHSPAWRRVPAGRVPVRWRRVMRWRGANMWSFPLKRRGVFTMHMSSWRSTAGWRRSPRWRRSAGWSGAGSTVGGKRGWTKRPPRRLRVTRGRIALLFLLSTVMSAVLIIRFFDVKLREPLFFLAKTRLTQIATEAINAAIAERFAEQAATDSLIRWQKDDSGRIIGFVIDYKEQLKITSETIRIVQGILREKEEIPEHIPLGHALKSPLLSAIGPRVSVTFHPLGAVKADVETRQVDAGINNVLVEVFLRIRTDIAIVIPFDREPETIETEIPLSYLLVVGDVPLYYYDNKGNPVGSGAAQAPPIALPGLHGEESRGAGKR